MATIREYFETDFDYGVRVHAALADGKEPVIDIGVVYDFPALNAFVLCYVPGSGHDLQFFIDLLGRIEPGKTSLNLGKGVTLPSARYAHYDINLENKPGPLSLAVQFYGDSGWVSVSDVPSSGRLIIYAESDLTDVEILTLQKAGRDGRSTKVLFRSSAYVARRMKFEKPRAFISHDSRDKADIARKIAVGLQRMMCPVWYDEFSLKVGDSLRQSIEAGLKSCKKCVLILSQNFMSNGGWTKREFDSIFTREVLEERRLVLPVWVGITRQMVFDYSPSLLDIKGIDWNQLGEDEVCRQLNLAVGDE